MPEPFEILEHTADIGFRAWGRDAAGVFVNSARAMLAIAAEDGLVAGTSVREVEIEAEDYESLLVNWLSELLYLFDSNEFMVGEIDVESIAPTGLKARLRGEPRDPSRHRWKLIVKAVTYYGLEVRNTGAGWEARVFLDI